MNAVAKDRVRLWVFGIIGAWILILLLGSPDTLFIFAFHLMVGGFQHLWVSYAYLVPSPWAVAGFLVLLAMTVALLHFLLGRFARANPDGVGLWHVRWTLSFVLLMLAAFGTACATVGVVHHVAWLGREGLISPQFGHGPLGNSMRQCRMLLTGLRLYSADHGGNYPATLDALVQNESISAEELARCRNVLGTDDVPMPWIFLPGLTDASAGNLPLIVSPVPVSGDRYIIGMNDTSVTLASREDYDKALAAYREHLAGKKRTAVK